MHHQRTTPFQTIQFSRICKFHDGFPALASTQHQIQHAATTLFFGRVVPLINACLALYVVDRKKVHNKISIVAHVNPLGAPVLRRHGVDIQTPCYLKAASFKAELGFTNSFNVRRSVTEAYFSQSNFRRQCDVHCFYCRWYLLAAITNFQQLDR